MPQKRTYILLSISIITTVCAALFVFFAFRFISNKNLQAVELSKNIQEKINQEENLTKFKKVIQETNEKNALLKSYIVDQDRIDQLVTYLEAKGDSVGVPIQIKNVDVSTINPNTISLSFDGEGAFSNVMNLVWIMENLPYSVNINSISLSSDASGKWKLNMKLDVTSNQTIQ